MTYRFIRNKIRTGEPFDRRLVEIVGFSTKRDAPDDDDDRIGEKGSGKKLSGVAMLRAELPSVIAAVDEAGAYLLDFVSKTMTVGKHSIDRISIRHRSPDGREEAVSTSWCVDAFADWGKPIGDDPLRLFKPLREHVIDAYDADKAFAVGTCDEVRFAAEDEVIVYLGEHPDFAHVFANPARYFKFMSGDRPLAGFKDIGEIWPKSEEGVTRCFMRGVLIDCSRSRRRSSAFDYSLRNKRLVGEDRTLTSSLTFEAQVGSMLALLEDVDVCASILRAIDEGRGETEASALSFSTRSLSEESKRAWLAAAHQVFGKKIALADDDARANSDAQDVFGCRLINCARHDFKRFLQAVGVPLAEQVMPREGDDGFAPVAFDELDEASKQRFRSAFSIFAALFPDRTKYPNYFFYPQTAKMRQIRGFAGTGRHRFRQVWIATTSPTTLPSVTEILQVLIHETRHCKTQLGDHDAAFALAAEGDITDLVQQVVLARGNAAKSVRMPVIGTLEALARPPMPEVIADFRIDDLPKGGLFG